MTGRAVSTPEVLVVGRVSVDFYPELVGRPLADASVFRSAIGGTSANVAVASARLGHHTALITKVGDDPLGRYVRAALERHGVTATGVKVHPTLATPVVFIELNPPTEPSIWFYRKPSAPDEFLTVDDLDLQLVERVPVLWLTGGAMAFEPSASTMTALLRTRGRRRHTVLDIDYRSMFWRSPADAGAAVRPLLDHVTVAVGNREECEVTVGTGDPQLAAARMLDHGVELAVVKMGGDGVLAVASDGTSVVVPPTPVEVVCGLGAGDAGSCAERRPGRRSPMR